MTTLSAKRQPQILTKLILIYHKTTYVWKIALRQSIKCARSVLANVSEREIDESRSNSSRDCYIHFRKNNFGKCMNLSFLLDLVGNQAKRRTTEL